MIKRELLSVRQLTQKVYPKDESDLNEVKTSSRRCGNTTTQTATVSSRAKSSTTSSENLSPPSIPIRRRFVCFSRFFCVGQTWPDQHFDKFNNFWQLWQFLTILWFFSRILTFFFTILTSLTIFDNFLKVWQIWQLLKFFDNYDIFLKFRQICQLLTIFYNVDFFYNFLGVFRVLESFCDLRHDTWDTDYISDNWEQQYGQLHCDLWI